MTSKTLPLSVVVYALCLSACSQDFSNVQLNEVKMTASGAMAWSNADRPQIVDLDDSYNYTFAELPTSGESTKIPWASDYWGTYRDSINFKWPGKTQSASEKFGLAFEKANIEDGVSFGYGIDSRPLADICSSNDDCEPKNGVATACAKRDSEAKGFCMETWTGICHAWAPAAILEEEPEHAVTHNGVEFSVMDIKALITLAYDKGLQSSFVGTRCNQDLNAEGDEAIEFDDFGRPIGCEDTNPGTLHLVMANLIGLQGKTLVEDRTIDYQVWNQPIRGYELPVNEAITAQQANELLGIKEGERNEEATGDVASKQWSHLEPYTVAEGENVLIEMTGNGDADMYVKFGSQPTSAEYDCRPYTNGSNETCTLTAPAGATQIFVSVYAYAVPSGEENLNYTLASKLGGVVPTAYTFNDDAVTFRKMQMRLKWITEAHATAANDEFLGNRIDQFTRTDVYDYILELDADGKIIGGEWFGDSKKAHPDFLWLPTMKSEVEVATPPVYHVKEELTITAGEWKDFGSFDVEAGQTVTFTMNGDGDADMYVGINNAPSDSSNACSGTISTNEERLSKQQCAGTVGSGWNKLYVKVKGVAETSTVTLKVSTQTPGTGITWAEIQGLLEQAVTVDPCAENNGGCDANYYTCNNNDGVAQCVDINECAVNNGGCDANFYTCTNNVGAAVSCQDINECEVNNGGCDNNAACTNNVGAVATCECNAFYEGNGVSCTDVNECETNNGGCDTNAACTNNVGAAVTCSCNSFFEGNGVTCSDINECAVNNGGCTSTETCANNVGAAPTCQPTDNGGGNGGDNGNGNGNGGDSGGDGEDGFDWGSACESGSGEFNQPIAFRDTVVVGNIPADKASVFIQLTSDQDVDVQIIDSETGTEIIAWPNGLVNGATESCTTYEGVEYCYSGYNGDGTNLGHEWIRVNGTTNRPLVMKAYGYRAGDALVNYSWAAPEDCVDQGSGEFNQPIEHQATVTVGDIPAGKQFVFIQLSSDKDVDVQLIDKTTGHQIIAWPNGDLNAPTEGCTTYESVEYCYSGYNGDQTPNGKGNEWIRVNGTTNRELTMRAFGYQAGNALVEYSWGVENAGQ